MEVSNQQIQREKQKARSLRKSTWWQNRIRTSPPCYYCQKKLDLDQVTMDHVIPISRGGQSTKGNVVVCCKSCNSEKKWRNPVEMILGMDHYTDEV